MVRMRGLEPPRCHHHRLLRPARLPVPPHPHAGNSLCERGQALSRKHHASLSIIHHTSSHSSAAIAQEVISRCVVSVFPASTQNTAKAISSWTATVPTTVTCVVAVLKLRALSIVVGQRCITSCGPTYSSNTANVALALSAAMTLCQSGGGDGCRQQQTHDYGPKKVSSITRMLHTVDPPILFVPAKLDFTCLHLQKARIALRVAGLTTIHVPAQGF